MNAQELLRALHDRIDNLDRELDDLSGKQVIDSGRQGVATALATLRNYPDDLRALVRSRVERSTRPAALSRLLRGYLQAVVQATGQIQQWFAAPYSDTVPAALLDAVHNLCADLRLEIESAVITVGAPTRLETVVSDVRRAVYAEVEAAEAPGPPFALVSIPRHEASSPRWWPVILGHELAHLFLRRLEREEQDEPLLQTDALDDLDLSQSSTYLLKRLGLLASFPIARMKEIVRAEHDSEIPTAGKAEPPGLGDVLVDSSPHDDGSDVASTVVKRLEIANSWLQELACDLAMVRRFGPAGIAAMGNYLTAIGDFSRVAVSHPPGLWRIQMMVEYLGSVSGDIFSVVLAPWVGLDSEGFPEAQPEWVREITDFLHSKLTRISEEVDTWPGERYDATADDRVNAVLLAQRQLSIGIPPFAADPSHFLPGAVEGGCPDGHRDPIGPLAGPVTGTTVNLVEEDVINAGWAVSSVDAGMPRIPTDRLVLKAVESIQLLRLAREDRGIATQAADDQGADDTTPIPLNPGSGTLTGAAITARLDEVNMWRRLIVVPHLDGAVQRGGMDLRLSNRFIVFQRTGTSSFDARQRDDPRAVQRLVERGWGVPFVLHPGEIVLAAPLEYVVLPVDLSAQVITRSSYGRLGLLTATAVQVHPLYRGCLTLELVNLGTVPLKLYPGERIAQLVFFNVDQPHTATAPTREDLFGGTYPCPTGPEFPRVSLDDWVRRTADKRHDGVSR